MSENIQVPQGWEVKKLGEVCTLEYGSPLPEAHRIKGIVPIYSSAGIVGYHNTKLINGPCIIIGRKGSAGSVFLSKTDAFCIDTAFYINTNNNVYFLYYLLINLRLERFKSDGSVPGLNRNDVYIIPVLLPPLEEQKKIADILSLWDKAIEQTKELIAYKEKQKKGLMQALLTGKKRLNGFTDEWKTVKLGECFKNFGGAPLEKYMDIAGKYKFISIGNYSTHGKYIDNGNRVILNDITQTKLLNKNDLVMVLNDKTADGKIIGATILIDEDNTYIYNQRSERLVCNKNVFPLFFWFLLNSELIRKEIFAMAQGGTQIYINFSSIKSINFFLPPLAEQEAIADILSKADEEIELLNKQLELYTEQKKGLMQNLLTGKVRV